MAEKIITGNRFFYKILRFMNRRVTLQIDAFQIQAHM